MSIFFDIIIEKKSYLPVIKTCKKNHFLYTLGRNMQETTETTHLEAGAAPENETITHATTEHVGPHIPSSKWEAIDGFSLGWLPITNTVFSTWLFMAVFFVIVAMFYAAIRTKALPRVRALGLDVTDRLFAYSTSLLGNAQMARRYMWLLGGIMVIVFMGNIFGLLLDWLVLISANNWLAVYLRPMYSDLSTTLVLSSAVILIAQVSAIMMKWPINHFGHYFFNYHGVTTAEKVVSVFVGWLHFFGEFIRIGSLSMRLFLNIFVGAILISVMVYVGNLVPSFGTGAFSILALPFWFFELLVAFLQAYIFMTLSSLYIREAIPESHQH